MGEAMSDRIWVCDVCTTSGFWTGEWQWFGSILTLEENGRPDLVTCSDTCRNTDTAERLCQTARGAKKPRRPSTPRPLTTRQLLEQRIAELQSELAGMDAP